MMAGERINKLSMIADLERRLEQGENIISYLTKDHSLQTTVDDELISYDLRAGEDIFLYEKNPSLRDNVIQRIAELIQYTGVISGSIAECGSGEGLNLVGLMRHDRLHFEWLYGFDISWSKCFRAMTFCKRKGLSDRQIEFIVGDFFSLPLKENSVDIVYTMQGIYGMGGYERVLLSELYRVTARYLILIEPSYELAGDEAKNRMNKLGYIKGLPEVANELGYQIVRYELFGVDVNPLNPAAVMIIKKNNDKQRVNYDSPLCCPITKTDFSRIGNAWYSQEAGMAYPIVNGVSCLTKENAIVATKMGEWEAATK